jgi:predicted O-methyltransferase YrrM
VRYTVNPIRDFLEIEGYSYRLSLDWVKREPSSWLVSNLPEKSFRPGRAPHARRIEERTAATQKLGAKPLWQGYGQNGAVRAANEVRTSARMGCLFTWLVLRRKPSVVVEFGTAFGTSGMYWLSGLETTRSGKLFTFEPNREWAAIARENLRAISTRFDLTEGTFEDNVEGKLGDGPSIDIAFIDAIHTSAFVLPQFKLVLQHLKPGGLVLFDDVDFSDDMADCWRQVAQDDRVHASVMVESHVGVVQV